MYSGINPHISSTALCTTCDMAALHCKACSIGGIGTAALAEELLCADLENCSRLQALWASMNVFLSTNKQDTVRSGTLLSRAHAGELAG